MPAKKVAVEEKQFEVVDRDKITNRPTFERSAMLDNLADAVAKAHPKTVKFNWSEYYTSPASMRPSVTYAILSRLRARVKISVRGNYAFVYVADPKWAPENVK